MNDPKIVVFPGTKVIDIADHQNERRPSGLASKLGYFSSAKPPEPRISPELIQDRDIAQLKAAIKRMSDIHGWTVDDIWRTAKEEMI